MIFSPLGFFVKTLSAGDKDSFRNSENLLQSKQMQLTKNLKTFPQLFSQFLESPSKSQHFGREYDPGSL